MVTCVADLAALFAEQGLSVSDHQCTQMYRYAKLLHHWNKRLNLTGSQSIETLLNLHLPDAISVLPYVPEGVLVDVGTGGGLPGIPLAIMCPNSIFYLIDKVGKKTRFLTEVKGHLGLSNINVIHGAVQSVEIDQPVAGILSRAYASLANMAKSVEHLCGPATLLLAMKGQFPQEEIDALGDEFVLKKIIELALPGREDQRHLLIIAKKEP